MGVVTVGKHGSNGHVSILADVLSVAWVAFSNSTKTFRGSAHKAYLLGHLPEEWKTIYYRTAVTYTVFSYNTVIGWRDIEGNWTVPDAHYSAITSGHQSKLIGALVFNSTDFRSRLDIEGNVIAHP